MKTNRYPYTQTNPNYTLSKEVEPCYVKRIKWLHDYPRDYAYSIFERYQRRFGMVDIFKAAEHLKKIQKRWVWGGNKSFFHVPPTPSLWMLWETEGDFCPIGIIGHLDYRGFPHASKCKTCGSPLRVMKGSVIRLGREIPESGVWSTGFFKELDSLSPQKECTNKKCADIKHADIKQKKAMKDASRFMYGIHEDELTAKELKVNFNRPMRLYCNASEEEKIVIALASLVDFEARYKKKLAKEENRL
jgi:hypothetical protein